MDVARFPETAVSVLVARHPGHGLHDDTGFNRDDVTSKRRRLREAFGHESCQPETGSKTGVD